MSNKRIKNERLGVLVRLLKCAFMENSPQARSPEKQCPLVSVASLGVKNGSVAGRRLSTAQCAVAGRVRHCE